jgi:hypothetical protein
MIDARRKRKVLRFEFQGDIDFFGFWFAGTQYKKIRKMERETEDREMYNLLSIKRESMIGYARSQKLTNREAVKKKGGREGEDR